jgi:mono/diheme cytochrome c family protein
MKKFWVITGCVLVVMTITSCDKVRRNTGRAYMPDMTYSVAYETYASSAERLKASGANYTRLPVTGTIARGDMLNIYPYQNDSSGYVQSATFKNPLNADSINKTEAERLYLVNCGICHGSKLDGNGPLYNDGKGPFPNAPKNFMTEDMKKMAEGTMFHSVTYGKNSMGSYASQLSTMQRWMVIAYIKSKQAGGSAGKDSASATSPKMDSTANKTK